MRTFQLLIFIALLLGGVFPGTVAGGESLSFSWAFFLKANDREVRSLEFADPEPIAKGDLLRIYIELHQQSYVYLYLFDARQDLYLVFPPATSFYEGEFPSWHKSYIPSGSEWFTLDDYKGTERFYLLAANRRLPELEKLTASFVAANDDAGLKDQLLEKIEDTMKSFSADLKDEIHPTPVHYGNRLGIARPELLLNGHAVSTAANYGMILEMVNK